MVPSPQQPLNKQQGKESMGINSKTRKRLIIRMELDLKPETSVVFVVDGQRWQRIEKRKVDICGLQEVQWRDQEACFIGVEEDTSYGDWEIVLKKIMWEYWSRSVVEI